MHCDPMCKDYS